MASSIHTLLWLLLIAFCKGNMMWFHEQTDAKSSPIANFQMAMEGYDVVKSDSFVSPDPGKRKQIFDPFYLDSGRTYIRSFVDEIRQDQQCDDNFEVLLVKDDDQFAKEKSKGYPYFIELKLHRENDKSNGANENSEFGEFVLGRANCITAAVDISLFDKPIFTEKFQNAVKILYGASKTPMSIRSKTTAIAFFRTFGTHFMKSTKLGSKIVFWSKLSDISDVVRSTDKYHTDLQCVTDQVKTSISKSKGNVSFAIENFMSTSKCENFDSKKQSVKLTDGNILKSKKMLVTGKLPKQSMNSWATQVIDSPLPVSFELMKISYFFRNEWMDFLGSESEGGDELDTESLYNFFETNLHDYCLSYLGRRCVAGQPTNGYIRTTDQGETDGSKPVEITNIAICNEVNVDKEDRIPRAAGFQHGRMTRVVISGGFSGMNEDLSNVEELSHSTVRLNISDLPDKMGGHSLTAVGTVLYNCGGSTPWKVTSTKHACYALNTSDGSPTWSHVFDLPQSIKNFHTALAIKSQIWFFDRGSYSLYILDTNTTENVFSVYKLPFTVGNYMCVVTFNNTILIAIDTSNGDIYKLENLLEPENWFRVHFELEKRFSPVCLTVDSNVYITGDGEKNASENFEVYNIGSNMISEIARFDSPRVGYAMFELDGDVAAIGGMYRNGSEIFNSVETFNSTSNAWQEHDWRLKTARVWFALAQIN